MRVAILQSNYIPWKGYFDIIDRVDLIVFHDDLQYTKQDWRNRNRIKTHNGATWMTVPCGTSEKRLICEVTLNDSSWQEAHWKRLFDSYHSTRFFHSYEPFLREVYLERVWKNLSDLNQFIIKYIARELLSIGTEFDDSRRHELKKTNAERVLELLRAVNASHYLSGPAGRSYLSEQMFLEAGIGIDWMSYDHYQEYEQVFPPFEHNLTVLDVLFHTGPDARRFVTGARSPRVAS